MVRQARGYTGHSVQQSYRRVEFEESYRDSELGRDCLSDLDLKLIDNGGASHRNR